MKRKESIKNIASDIKLQLHEFNEEKEEISGVMKANFWKFSSELRLHDF